MTSLFSELRHRNVFKVGVAYAIVAWLLIQVADVLVPALQLPDWTITFITVQLLIGFPVALILAWAYEMTPGGIKTAAEITPSDRETQSGNQRFNVAIVGLLALAVAFLIVDRFVLNGGASANIDNVAVSASTANSTAPAPARTNGGPRPVRRFETSLGVTEPIGNTGLAAHIALSPDGRRLVYAARVEGATRLYLHDLETLETRAIPDTVGAYHPFFSPDGEWVGFYGDESDATLKRVGVRGSAAQTLAPAVFSAGGSWVTDDVIVYGTNDEQGGRGIFRVPASGGTPELLLESGAQAGYITPAVLPGGEAALVVERPGLGGIGNAREGRISIVDLATRTVETLISGGFSPRYAPTGHILFVRGGALWAVPFDAERRTLTGREVPVIQGVQQAGFTGGAAFSFSNDGLLAYVPGGDTSDVAAFTNLVWVDRDGTEDVLDFEPRLQASPHIAPDGRRVAVSAIAGGNWDIWIYDLERGTRSRLTFDPSNEWFPVWAPDGEYVAYTRTGQRGIFRRPADGTGSGEPLDPTSSAAELYPEVFTRDGAQIVVREAGPGGYGLYALSLGDETTTEPLINSDFNEQMADLSRDGRWLAYTSNETGSEEVYVRPFPEVDDGKWQISTAGGAEPKWSPDGTELFYRSGDLLMAVDVRTESGFAFGAPMRLFSGDYVNEQFYRPNYDVAPDGRFLMTKQADSPEQTTRETTLVFVENWFEELRRLVPPDSAETL